MMQIFIDLELEEKPFAIKDRILLVWILAIMLYTGFFKTVYFRSLYSILGKVLKMFLEITRSFKKYSVDWKYSVKKYSVRDRPLLNVL